MLKGLRLADSLTSKDSSKVKTCPIKGQVNFDLKVKVDADVRQPAFELQIVYGYEILLFMSVLCLFLNIKHHI